jgi:hypothetical protein
LLDGFTYQPSVVFDSKFQLPQAGSLFVLQLRVPSKWLPLQAYTQVEPEQEPVALGLAEHLPLALVQMPPAPSDFPHELDALQSGVLHWFRPDTQTCDPEHCDLQTSELLSTAQAVFEHAPQSAFTVPAIAVQPPHTLGMVPAHESELLSALQAHVRPHDGVPQLASFVAPAGVSALQPPHALGDAPVQVSEFLSAEQVNLPQLPLPHAAFSVPTSGVQPPQAFLPGSSQEVLALSVLHAYLPHCPHGASGALASVPQPPQALALTPEHFTSVLSAVHSQSPHEPHEDLGALANTPQPPHAFLPGSLQITDSLSAAHSYLPHAPHAVSGAATSFAQPPHALCFGSEQEVVVRSGLQTFVPHSPH